MPLPTLKPYWQTTDKQFVRLFHGDVIDTLKRLPEKSVHMVVTSPPYWGLRDYGVEGQIGSEPSPDCKTDGQAQCGRCFVCAMVAVFRDVRRVLRDDGTLWLNLGDTYSSGMGTKVQTQQTAYRTGRAGGEPWAPPKKTLGHKDQRVGVHDHSIPSGNLVGVPWRVALALQADGWVLRQDIIWSKPSPMPESVRNRCTKAHEYVFLLTKSVKYFYNAEAIKERVRSDLNSTSWADRVAAGAATGDQEQGVRRNHGNGLSHDLGGTDGRANKRSVWSISSQGYEGAHFATFPPKLIEPMVLAGTSEKGCCGDCGAPWKRVVSEGTGGAKGSSWGCHDDDDEKGNAKTVSSRGYLPGKTIGWYPSCECHGKFVKKTVVTKRAKGQVPTAQPVGSDDHTAAGHNTDEGRAKVAKDRDTSAGNRNGEGVSTLDAPKRITHDDLSEDVETSVIEYVSDIPFDEHPVVPCTVLDPFMGAATTSVVAIQNGRRSIGIELNEKYIRENQIPRVEGALLDRPATSHLVPGKETKVIKIGRDV